ncbi:extracellular solute-binding protein [Candidatus Actinomarina sp.]|nr:extracellular solute-binding protein [Candidatus Actinomarina sp.]
MDLFEYQGKSLYANYDIAHPNSFLVNKIEDLEQGFNLNYPVVVKAQVQVGGRGKAGGIKLATNNDELITHTNEILGMDIKGHTVEKILIEEASDIKEEYYLSFTLDRSEKKYLMMLSAKGGMDIEAVAEENPDDLTMIHIDPSKELDEAVLIDAITNSKLNQDYQSDLVAIITRLFKLFISGDCDLVEVNPLAITSSGVMALDSKVSLDMNAKYRHENFDQIEKDIPIPPSEKSAKEKGLNFIKLDGSVGIIGNGAGLVMSNFQEGRALFWMTGPWARGDASAVNYGVGLIPQFDGNAATPFVGVRGAMVSSFSDNQVLAQSFILDFFATIEVQQAMYESDPRLPATKSLFAVVEAADPIAASFAASASNGIPMPNIPEMGSVWGPMADALNVIREQAYGTNEETGVTINNATDAVKLAAEQVRNAIAGG